MGDKITRHTSLEAAKAACLNNNECGCIDDLNCDGVYWFSHKGYNFSSSGSAICAWIKGKWPQLKYHSPTPNFMV